MKKIVIKGAAENNLKNVNLEIPKEKQVIFTGVSGSGKSSLVFDTIFAESQRLYLSNLSSYAKQLLGGVNKPKVEKISGLSPSICLKQEIVSRASNSTLGTITGLSEMLRLLYWKTGTPFCPKCDKPLKNNSLEEIIKSIKKDFNGQKVTVLASLEKYRGRESYQELLKLFEKLKNRGFEKVRVQGVVKNLGDKTLKINTDEKLDLYLVVGDIIINEENYAKLEFLIKKAFYCSNGLITIEGKQKEKIFSQKSSCSKCGFGLYELEIQDFSFHSIAGACSKCGGRGDLLIFDPDLIIPDKNKTLAEGAILPWSSMTSYHKRVLRTLGKSFGFTLETPIKKMSKKQIDAVLYGSKEKITGMIHAGKFHGVIGEMERLYRKTKSEESLKQSEELMVKQTCPDCQGKKLKKEILAVKINGLSVIDAGAMTLSNLLMFLDTIKPKKEEWGKISKPIIDEMKFKIENLVKIDLDYLAIDRKLNTLSTGEVQRLRLSSQIESGLNDLIYILDEPTQGLHSFDIKKLIASLQSLKEKGNTLLLIDHNRELITSGDLIVDMGPGAGKNGGQVVKMGTLSEIKKEKKSLTGHYLAQKEVFERVQKRRKFKNTLTLKNAKANNLKNVTVKFPLGVFCVVTGVSGSGKSSLINDSLLEWLHLKKAKEQSKRKGLKIEGLQHVKEVIFLDQDRIGRSSRSNTATYTGLFDELVKFFANLPEAKERELDKENFSFNSPKEWCEECQGKGEIKTDMGFMEPIFTRCHKCDGKRYSEKILSIKHNNKNINDVLEMSIDEAYDFFNDEPVIIDFLKTLREVNLGYLVLGQKSTNLSGGEAQRIKLAKELSKKVTGSKTLYLLDEPSAGLHFDDVKCLVQVLNSLVDKGNSVIAIEHNLDVIRQADYVIDMGPLGGTRGGELVAFGTPEKIMRSPRSITGKFLKKF